MSTRNGIGALALVALLAIMWAPVQRQRGSGANPAAPALTAASPATPAAAPAAPIAAAVKAKKKARKKTAAAKKETKPAETVLRKQAQSPRLREKGEAFGGGTPGNQ